MLTEKKCFHMLSLLLKIVRDGEVETDTKNDDGHQIVVVFTITEINYLMVSIIYDLVRSLSD